MGKGVDLKPSNSATAMRNRLRSTAGMRSRRQCSELPTIQRVDLLLVGHGDAEQVFGKAAHLGLDAIAGLPEGGAHLVRGLAADVRLKQHLHGEFAGFAAIADASGQAGPPAAVFSAG